VPGTNNSGGSETQNFCYDEQNRLVWAGNSGTQPAAGNGTCGSGTLASGLNGASYSNAYVYTHLGQLWQGPLAGGSTQYQYLYCNSQPHELTGLYATSATCSNKSGQGYASSYDAFGNVTSRTFSGTTGTLSYDNFNHLTEWNAGSTNQEWYLYDAAGNRVLRRFTNSNGTTMIVYAFGLEEHNYSGAGAHQNDTYYYSLGGRLLGALDSNGTTFYLTDTLGSILASFNNAAGGASVKGNQVFAPYGTGRYYKGNINTLKGFTGQYNDGSGLDYYNARYYDPVAGVFLSADTVQGNAQGMNPYSYVGGNPETRTDPTGQRLVGPNGEMGWVNPDGTIYVQKPGQNPTVIGHTQSSSLSSGISTPPPNKKAGECTIDPASCRFKSWAYDAEGVRKDRLDALTTKGTLEGIGSLVLIVAGDILAFSDSTKPLLKRLDALIQIATDALAIAPLLASIFKGGIAQAIWHFAQWATDALGGVKTVLAGIRSDVWWISDAAQIAGTALIDSLGGPVELAVQTVMTLTKPAIGYLLGVGSYALQSASWADLAEAQRENEMPIQDWCAQYGGCRSLSSY